MAPPEFVSRARCPAVAPFKERPILFSAPMVRALLDGTKTQTRRVVTNPHRNDYGFVLQDYGKGWWPYRSHDGESGCYLDRQKDGDYYSEASLRCPFGQSGDRLWVREAWQHHEGGAVYDAAGGVADTFEPETIYRASHPNYPGPWRPSIHMPRWASRIDLEVTGVRVERLQDISEGDALAEGITSVRSPEWDGAHWPKWRREFDAAKARGAKPPLGPSPSEVYRALWEDISSAKSWAANPWVWAVTFRRIKP